MGDIRRPIGIRQVDIGGLPHLQVDHVRRVLQNGHGLFVRHLLQTVVVHLQRDRDSSGQREPSEGAAAVSWSQGGWIMTDGVRVTTPLQGVNSLKR